ncbi:MAG: hypothetical protein HY718_01660 [Planctomycetes bacterium]|nr:hypothetical protein [Planctomycetota bacterium]
MAATFGYVDDFTAVGTSGWSGGTPVSNPGTGGVDGAADGYLLLDSAFPGNFGSRTLDPNYQGDWHAAGITKVTFYLNDVGTPEDFEVHFLVHFFDTTWQYNIGFHPPAGCWRKFTVDLTNVADWTRTRGARSLHDVLSSVERVVIRHDLAPYLDFPDSIAGDLGIDKITLGFTPPTCHAVWADADDDGDVDSVDFAMFQTCLSSCGLIPPTCVCFDHNADGLIDAADLLDFEQCAGGPNLPPDPSCSP